MHRRLPPYRLLLIGAIAALLSGIVRPRVEARWTRPTDSLASHPADTRLLFTPSAWPIDAGEGYFALYELFFPFVGVGVTDFFSVAGGISIVPGADHHYLMIAPKVTPWATERLAVAGGLTYIGRTGSGGVGVVYADASFGPIGNSGTVGLGWGWSGSGISGRPVLLAGFLLSLGGGATLVSENWFPPDFDPAMLSLGARFTSGRMSADLALWVPARWDDSAGLFFLPWVSFAYGF